jgi:hypothetical protein
MFALPRRHTNYLFATLALWSAGCARQQVNVPLPTPPEVVVVEEPPPPAKPPRVELVDEAGFYATAAETAWRQFNELWVARTGLARATKDYDKVTPWDIASVMAANYAGHKLGFLTDSAYLTRMRTTLKTLQRIPLYRKAVFHKMYFAQSARMANRAGKVSSTGYGWSATDQGRLLVWLKIIAENDPELTADVEKVVSRVKFPETVANGYLRGGMIGSRGRLWRFQEGRIGYEQYAARGFAMWGAPVDSALDVNRNAKPITVLGVPLLADRRGLDRLNSEPFVLYGLELGFTPDMETLARNVLAAQEARFQQTGKLTMVSEDAVSVPPHFFYYYCVYCNGKEFTVDVVTPGKHLDEPRWVSTKAAFGYHTLFPSFYTKSVMDQIASARSERGWSSGVFEKNGRSTQTYDINTAAVVLEAALYRRTERPLIQHRQP